MLDNSKLLDELLDRSRAELGFSLGELIKIEKAEFQVINAANYLCEDRSYQIAIAHRLIDDTGNSILANRLLELSHASTIGTLKLSALFTGLRKAREFAVQWALTDPLAPGNAARLVPRAVERVFFPEGIWPAIQKGAAQLPEHRQYSVERTVTIEALPHLGQIKESMLVDVVRKPFADREQPDTILRFNFSYRGSRYGEHGLEGRQTKSYPGFPDRDDWQRFDGDWRKWNVIIRLQAIEVIQS